MPLAVALLSLAVAVPASPASPPRAGFATSADGVRLFYRRTGEGEKTTIVIHGGPGLNMANGWPDLEPLAQGRTVVFYDQRGGGKSDLVDDPDKLTAAAYVSDLDAVRTALGTPRVSLVGISWGAAVAVMYAAWHPDAVDRVLLVSPLPATRAAAERRMQALTKVVGPSSLKQIFDLMQTVDSAPDAQVIALCRQIEELQTRAYFHDPAARAHQRGDTCAYPPDVLRNQTAAGQATMAAMGDWDFRPILSRVKVPVLVMEGAETFAPPEEAKEWVDGAPDARLFLVPHAGHEEFIEQPAAFFAAARRFLDGAWPEP